MLASTGSTNTNDEAMEVYAKCRPAKLSTASLATAASSTDHQCSPRYDMGCADMDSDDDIQDSELWDFFVPSTCRWEADVDLTFEALGERPEGGVVSELSSDYASWASDDYDIVRATLDFARTRVGSAEEQHAEDALEVHELLREQAKKLEFVVKHREPPSHVRSHYTDVCNELLAEAGGTELCVELADIGPVVDVEATSPKAQRGMKRLSSKPSDWYHDAGVVSEYSHTPIGAKRIEHHHDLGEEPKTTHNDLSCAVVSLSVALQLPSCSVAASSPFDSYSSFYCE